MEKWEYLLADTGKKSLDDIKKNTEENFGKYNVYASSIQKINDTVLFIARQKSVKVLVLYGSKEYFFDFCGEERLIEGINVKVCKLNHDNCVKLRTLFPYTNPVSNSGKHFSFGLGDRLGVATGGHIRAIESLDLFPVLAQQSIRELTLTGRTYESVLDDVSWAVFQEGYKKGFGADADHLKTREEVKMGIECGYSMVTLDCSEYIDNNFFDTEESLLRERYGELRDERIREIEEEYLKGAICISRVMIEFNKTELMKCVLVYERVLQFIKAIYTEFFEKSDRKIDFEVSIDETVISTSPEAHYYIASQLKYMNVHPDSLAPRFCGEFQKGINYIGNIKEFERDFITHEKIAEHFGYRLSIHSGSDKFRVFPIIGKYTNLNVHVKTAGTNWLEAVRLIAEKNPSLYRRMHKFAIANLEKAKKYYHISARPEIIQDIDSIDDINLPELMDKDDSRQVLHITYGLILKEKDENDKSVFRDEIYGTLYKYEDEYNNNLIKHIGRHMNALGAK